MENTYACSIGTIVGIILTFGTSAIIQHCEKEESSRKAAFMIIHNINDFCNGLEYDIDMWYEIDFAYFTIQNKTFIMKLSRLKIIIIFSISVLFVTVTTAGASNAEPPVMGWSSWNTYRININEELIRKQADAMVYQGLKDAGYTHINIDDGFFGYRDRDGLLHTHPVRFPNGIKVLADYIHSKGLKAGIYSEAGANTCGSIWDADKNGIGVGLYGFERQDADLYFNKWGFDFIKIDYCGAGQQLELDEKERYTEITAAIREVCPRKISVNICRWAFPGTWAKKIARSWRISPDITPDWESVKSIISMNLYLSAYAGDGHYNDMDMLEIGRGLSPEEEQTHFGMWCIMSSPLLIGCDLTTIPESSLNLLKNKELIALNQDPLGLQAYVVQHDGAGYVLVKDVEKERGRTRAIALYNPSDTVCFFNVPLESLELQGKTNVKDLISGETEVCNDGFVKASVKAHGVRILKAEAAERIERTVYEAEQAFLNQYNALGKQRRGVTYMPHKEASGKMTVCNIGGHRDNYAEWDNVFSEKGGKYTMSIFYIPSDNSMSAIKDREVKDRRIEVTVNGKMTSLDNLETERDKGIQKTDIVVELSPGYNNIRLGSRLTWTPDIDCFILHKM